MFRSTVGDAPPSGMVHCASLCQIDPTQLAAVWYAGSREGARDVAIFYSTRDLPRESASFGSPSAPSVWSPPRRLIDQPQAEAELSQRVKKLGNPVLFSDTESRIWMVYVSVGMGGWSGSSLNAKVSQDGGRTWSNSQKLYLSPFLNISTLVRSTPVLLSSGEILLPIYHEFLGKFPELLRLRYEAGRVHYSKQRLVGSSDFIQPAIAVTGERDATVLHRDMVRRGTAFQTTRDAGQTWSPPAWTGLPNSNSSVAVASTSEQRLLVAWNDSPTDRANLTLALSGDGPQQWTRLAVIENEPGERFSYPSMIRDRDGFFHLVYTWKRNKIEHVTFNEAWLTRQEQAAERKRTT